MNIQTSCRKQFEVLAPVQSKLNTVLSLRLVTFLNSSQFFLHFWWKLTYMPAVLRWNGIFFQLLNTSAVERSSIVVSKWSFYTFLTVIHEVEGLASPRSTLGIQRTRHVVSRYVMLTLFLLKISWSLNSFQFCHERSAWKTAADLQMGLGTSILTVLIFIDRFAALNRPILYGPVATRHISACCSTEFVWICAFKHNCRAAWHLYCIKAYYLSLFQI